MKNNIVSSVINLVNYFLIFMGRFSIIRFLFGLIVSVEMKRVQSVNHNGLKLEFCVPTILNKARVDTFSNKEPETLEWIDDIHTDSVVWDIGANIGLYSCYAAKSRGCMVFAFEPSVFNLELLARNIVLNQLTEKIIIVPLPLTNSLTVSKLNMTSTEWGGALSTFDKLYGQDGKPLVKVFDFSTIGITMNDAVNHLGIIAPDYIKMDVDGIEHLILQGGQSLLEKVQGVIIEIDDEFDEQSRNSSDYLTSAGLTLIDKRHSEIVEKSAFRTSFNQIWSRNSSGKQVQQR